jgi:hypothetical protein
LITIQQIAAPLFHLSAKSPAIQSSHCKSFSKGQPSLNAARSIRLSFQDNTANTLISFRIQNQTAYINLKDLRQIIPNASASCGSAAFFSEVEATVKQFGTVKRIIFALDSSPKDFYEWMQIGCSDEENTL